MSKSKFPELYKDFVKTIEILARRHDRGKVFNDFLTAAICTYHRTNIQTQLQEKDEANEALYMEAISRYNKEEINTLPKLLGIFMGAVETEPYSDLLGQFFTKHVTQGQNGQFFTPNSVCDVMAQLQGPHGTVTGKRVADPSSGSGRLLLSFAKHNPDNYFYASECQYLC